MHSFPQWEASDEQQRHALVDRPTRLVEPQVGHRQEDAMQVDEVQTSKHVHHDSQAIERSKEHQTNTMVDDNMHSSPHQSPPPSLSAGAGPDTSFVQEASSQRTEQGLTRLQQLKANRSTFAANWNKLQIDFQNPPEATTLAEMVIVAEVSGMHKATFARYAASLVRAKFPTSYSDDYFRRLKSLREKQKTVRQSAKKAAKTSSTSQGLAQSRRQQSVKAPRGGAKKGTSERELQEQRDQERVIQAIADRGWWDLGIVKFEELTRGFELKDASPIYCTWVIRRHLIKAGRAADADAIPRLRKNWQARARRIKANAKGGQAKDSTSA